jgi:hypothetical protein
LHARGVIRRIFIFGFCEVFKVQILHTLAQIGTLATLVERMLLDFGLLVELLDVFIIIVAPEGVFLCRFRGSCCRYVAAAGIAL